MAAAVFRAVELRAGLVRAGNTGLTCIVDPAGRITTRIERDSEGVMSGPVMLDARVSVFSRTGSLATWILAAGVFVRLGTLVKVGRGVGKN